LKGPSPREPPTARKLSNVFHVSQIHVTNARLPIPAKHRIDSFRELGRAGFVDAASASVSFVLRLEGVVDLRIYPCPLELILEGLLATETDLCETFSLGHITCFCILYLLQSAFFLLPGMRKNRIGGDHEFVQELVHPQRGSIDETHGVRLKYF
jgi:hypothetical protein